MQLDQCLNCVAIHGICYTYADLQLLSTGWCHRCYCHCTGCQALLALPTNLQHATIPSGCFAFLTPLPCTLLPFHATCFALLLPLQTSAQLLWLLSSRQALHSLPPQAACPAPAPQRSGCHILLLLHDPPQQLRRPQRCSATIRV